MAGKIHPLDFSLNDLKFFPLVDLVWIAWDRHRGSDHVRNCASCRYVGEWCLDLIWSKWDHQKFIIYNEFIYKFVNTNLYDEVMNKVSSVEMPTLEKLFIDIGGGWEGAFFF